MSKFQNPKSKIQRSSNDQVPKNGERGRCAGVTYSPIFRRSLRVNDSSEPPQPPYDLEERTTQFGEAVVRFSKKIPRDPTNNPLITQLVRCSTSVGANYCEANERVSKKDFRNTIGRCVKEAKESKFFLRMIAASESKLLPESRMLYREAKELHLIFATIYRK